jgi:AcrR family transcriptional regulator
MAITRLDSDERRKAIVSAAVPLFARKGFAGTTTRELAEAAGISEALLFRHFPSKQLLYREILQLGCEGDPALEELTTLEPSTGTLVCMVRFMVRRFLLGGDAERAELDPRLRLLLHSFLEDGDYARELFETVSERVVPLFEASLKAAIAAGDATPRADAPANIFWFAQHVAAMMAFVALPGASCIPYAGTLDDIVGEASTFILRGIGMTDAAIAAENSARGRPLQSAAD